MASSSSPDTNGARILVVDDEMGCRRVLARALTRCGYLVSTACDVASALDALRTQPIEVVMTDVKLPDGDGLDLIRSIHSVDADLPCIAMTGAGGPHTSVDSLRAGAFWFLEKPFDQHLSVLDHLIAQALAFRRERSGVNGRRHSGVRRRIVGHSTALKSVLTIVDKVARSNATVLVTGESGTGKELIARAVHEASPRAERPFVPVNCGAIPEQLLESELFGHVKGAFTNAFSHREGRFNIADGGTIFLDEIGDMSLSLQVKLLRVLQDGAFEPVGSSVTRHVDVRTIAATNHNMEVLVREGRFREGL